MEMTNVQTVNDLAKKMHEILTNKGSFSFGDQRRYCSSELVIQVYKKLNIPNPYSVTAKLTEWFQGFVCMHPRMAVQIFLADKLIEAEELARDLNDGCISIRLVYEAYLRYGPRVADLEKHPAQGPIGSIH